MESDHSLAAVSFSAQRAWLRMFMPALRPEYPADRTRRLIQGGLHQVLDRGDSSPTSTMTASASCPFQLKFLDCNWRGIFLGSFLAARTSNLTPPSAVALRRSPNSERDRSRSKNLVTFLGAR